MLRKLTRLASLDADLLMNRLGFATGLLELLIFALFSHLLIDLMVRLLSSVNSRLLNLFKLTFLLIFFIVLLASSFDLFIGRHVLHLRRLRSSAFLARELVVLVDEVGVGDGQRHLPVEHRHVMDHGLNSVFGDCSRTPARHAVHVGRHSSARHRNRRNHGRHERVEHARHERRVHAQRRHTAAVGGSPPLGAHRSLVGSFLARNLSVLRDSLLPLLFVSQFLELFLAQRAVRWHGDEASGYSRGNLGLSLLAVFLFLLHFSWSRRLLALAQAVALRCLQLTGRLLLSTTSSLDCGYISLFLAVLGTLGGRQLRFFLIVLQGVWLGYTRRSVIL